MSGASFQSLMASVSSGGGGGPSDPDFSSVVLLLGFEGTNGSTGSPGLDDESLSAHGTLAGGGANSNISTTQSKFGVSSLHLTGNAVFYSDSADWNLGSGHFTIELFVYPGTVSGVQFLIGQWQSVPSLGWELYMSSDKLAWNTSTTGSDNNSDITGSTSIVANAWQHVCIDYDGSKYRVYVQGVMNGSFATPRTLFDSPLNLTIGASQNGSFLFNPGFIDEVRITKGIARYATDGSFAVPTAPFPRS